MADASNPWFLGDDLSGVLEVAGAWSAAGAPVSVALGDASADGDETSLRGVSSETRNASSVQARDRIAALLAADAARHLVFKKIDSTLRGPVAAELAALRAVCPERPVLISPANPAVGRTVVGGCLLVDGVPVHETAFAHDPIAPVRESHVSTVFADPGGKAIVEIGHAVVAAGGIALERALDAGWLRSAVVSVDAVAADDLERVLVVARAVRPGFLPIGSGGLARAMLGVGLVPGASRVASATPAGNWQRVLVVVGSVHPASRRQLTRLVVRSAVQPCVAPTGSAPASIADALAFSLDRHGLAALTSDLPTEGAPSGADASGIAAQLGEIVAQVQARTEIDAIIVTGGDVAQAVFHAIGGTRLDARGEFEPGVAFSRLVCVHAPAIDVIVKPGGFGRDDLFTRLLAHRVRPGGCS